LSQDDDDARGPNFAVMPGTLAMAYAPNFTGAGDGPQTFYFNGFEVGNSTSDMACVLMLNGTPVATICMSFTTAKTFAMALGHAVAQFERATDHTIMTMDEVQRGLEAYATGRT